MDPNVPPKPPAPEIPTSPPQPGVADLAALAEQRLPIAALTDWIMLLQGPAPPLFVENRDFQPEWKRLFRLGALVLLLLGTIIAIFSLGIAEPGQKWADFTTKLQYLTLTLVIGAVVAVPYAFVLAPLLRIRITFAQTFFTVLFLGLPWLPLIALVWAIGRVQQSGLLVVILLYILSLVPLHHFCKGVSVIAVCGIWRVVLSLAIPTVLALTVFIANFVL